MTFILKQPCSSYQSNSRLTVIVTNNKTTPLIVVYRFKILKTFSVLLGSKQALIVIKVYSFNKTIEKFSMLKDLLSTENAVLFSIFHLVQ